MSKWKSSRIPLDEVEKKIAHAMEYALKLTDGDEGEAYLLLFGPAGRGPSRKSPCELIREGHYHLAMKLIEEFRPVDEEKGQLSRPIVTFSKVFRGAN